MTIQLVRNELYVADDVVPRIVIVRIAIEDATDLVSHHLKRLSLLVQQYVPIRTVLHRPLDILRDSGVSLKCSVSVATLLQRVIYIRRNTLPVFR